MTFMDRVAILAIICMSWITYYNAKEAHRHAHELACAINHENLCKWHKGTDK